MTQQPDTATARGTSPGRPAINKTPEYWARIKRIVDQAPPLTDDQKVRIRAAIHRPQASGRAAA